MLIRYVFCFFLLISGHFIVAQDISNAQRHIRTEPLLPDKEIQQIDSLIKYNQFEIAQRKTDSLYQQLSTLSKRKKQKEQLLELKFRQAVILSKQDGSPRELLQILLSIIDEAEALRLHTLSYRIHLLVALTHERTEIDPENLKLTNEHLNKAYKIYKDHNLEELYSTYCIRKSSYHRRVHELDSTFFYVKQAKEYAEKYPNEQDLMDSYMLLAFCYAEKDKNYEEALAYHFLLLEHSIGLKDTTRIVTAYNNIAKNYLRIGDFSQALSYNDLAYVYYNKTTLTNRWILTDIRYKAFEHLGNIDSAYHYFKQFHNDMWKLLQEQEKLYLKNLEEQYQNDKKTAVIKSREQQLIFIITLLGVIALATVLLFRKNRQINQKNNIISRQLGELTRTLEQKQVLLSELQHRVKNNLQHVISILEIQKESVDFNNVEELIRGNQNRIHSMALLHKKLHVSDHVNEVDLERYITELSELVKDSYDSHKKKISLDITCGIEKMSIENALPLGLILVELVSNSMKHAFKKRNIGMIHIRITKDEVSGQSMLYYADNGSGFDFNNTSGKGLGMEIIKGLIDQLGGRTETSNDNGFELSVYFK